MISCKNCKYFNFGLCKRYPPKQVLVRKRRLADSDTWKYVYADQYPIVEENEGCGEGEEYVPVQDLSEGCRPPVGDF